MYLTSFERWALVYVIHINRIIHVSCIARNITIICVRKHTCCYTNRNNTKDILQYMMQVVPWESNLPSRSNRGARF